MTLQVLIVEDEAMVARRLRRLLVDILGADGVEIAHAPDLSTARRTLASAPDPDVLFLDLNLNGRDGFDLLSEAVSERFEIVVVSAHAERAIEAFEVGVLDFIAKPFSRDRLALALERLERRSAPERAVLRLAVRRHGRLQLVSVDEIVQIRGADDYAELCLADGSTLLHAKTLDALERLLKPRFHRVHRSTLVDLSRVEALLSEPGSRYFLRLEGGERIRVGRSKLPELRERLARGGLSS
ncbi:MAG: LytTR family DNA-binding domain-containing protein [Acidobacteriota bacterium]